MNKKLKPWKYGLIGSGISLLYSSIGFYLWFDTSDILVTFIPFVLLGYIGGSLGGRLIRSRIGAVFTSLFGGLIITVIGAGVVDMYGSIGYGLHHYRPAWFFPSIIITCLAFSYQIKKDFRSRICPVCGTLIPSIKMTRCPKCEFDLGMVDDKEAIESAKQNLDRVKNDKSISATGHLIAGFIGTLVAQIVYFIVWPWGAIDMQCFAMPTFFLLSLPFGLLTGYLGYLLEKKLNRRLNMRFVYLILTFILSIVTSVLFLKLVLDKSYHP